MEETRKPPSSDPIVPSPFSDHSLVVVSAEELLTREIKERDMLLAPVLARQDISMLYSSRGIGKTFIALGIAAAVASGSPFLRWRASGAHRVVFVDGELPGRILQERVAMVLAGIEESEPASEMLKVITPDLQYGPMPDLATVEGQCRLEEHLVGAELLVLDNLSALCRASENDGDSWLPIQEWALGLRRRGVSVLFVHHAGKNNSQRGTSRREDLLDVVIALKRPADYHPREGLRCEIRFEKMRSLVGDAAESFEIRMVTGSDGRAVWTHRDLDDALADKAAALFSLGRTVREVADELKISKSQAGRLRQQWALQRRSELSRCPSSQEEKNGTN